MKGRPAKIARDPYVLTHEEVVRDYFRRSPAALPPEALDKGFPSFPKPGRSGLYLRKAVEAWIDRDYNFRPQSPAQDETEAMLEAVSGRRRDPAFSHQAD